MPSASVLKKLANAKATGNGKYLEAGGRYRLRIDKITLEDKRKGATFIAEHTIVKAEDTGDQNLKLVEGTLQKCKVPLHIAGDTRNYVVPIPSDEEKEKMALGNIRSYLEGLQPDLAGSDEDAVLKFLELVTGPSQIAKGWELDVDVYQKPQKTDKTKPFTVQNWKNVPRAAPAPAAAA